MRAEAQLQLAASVFTHAREGIMITDGEPTAHMTPSGQPFFSYPPARETVDLTLAEVVLKAQGRWTGLVSEWVGPGAQRG